MSARSHDGGGDRSIEEIRRDIERRRDSITRTVDQVGQKVQETLSWREQVGDHPYAALSLAAGAGFLLALAIRRRRTPSERLVEALADNVEEIGESLRDAIRGAGSPSRSGLFGSLAGVAGAMATRAAMDLARDRLTSRFGSSRSEEPGLGADRPERPPFRERPPGGIPEPEL